MSLDDYLAGQAKVRELADLDLGSMTYDELTQKLIDVEQVDLSSPSNTRNTMTE